MFSPAGVTAAGKYTILIGESGNGYGSSDIQPFSLPNVRAPEHFKLKFFSLLSAVPGLPSDFTAYGRRVDALSCTIQG